MSVNATDAQSLASLTGASQKPAEERVKPKTLGQDDFFKLLTTQLASQDPLKPMEDTAFIAQMASFSELEMTSNLTKSFESFNNVQQFNSAQGFIGKRVSLSSGEVGTVTAIERQNGETLVFLDGANIGFDINKVYKVESVGGSSAGSGNQSQSYAISDAPQVAAPVIQNQPHRVKN